MVASIHMHVLEVNLCHEKHHTATYCDLIENIGVSWPSFDYLCSVISVARSFKVRHYAVLIRRTT